MNNTKSSLSSKDYFLISFIALSFTIFTVPIIKNLDSFLVEKGLTFLRFSPLSLTIEAILIILIANIALWVSSIAARRIPVFLQISKFAAVGAFNTFLNWGVVNVLMLLSQTFKGPLFTLFNVVAFIIANIGSFFWNKYWIFPTDTIKDHDSAKKDFMQFFVVSAIGAAIYAGISSAWVALAGGSSEELSANIGLFLGTLVSMIWNFLGYKFIVFKK